MSDPSDSEAIAKNDEGMRLWHVRDYDAALAALTDAITLNPNFEVAYLHRASLYRIAIKDPKFQAAHPNRPAAYRKLNPEHPRMSRKAFARTAIPIVALSVISTVGAAAEGFYFVWFVAAAFWLIAILAAGGFAFRGRRSTANAIIAGLIVGIFVLAGTCVANVETIDYNFIGGPGW
jgi:hypothetical protein